MASTARLSPLALTAVLLAPLLVACGGNSGAPGDGDACEHASDCEGDRVCEPDTDTCTTEVPCAGHPDCGNGGHCAESGTCEPSGTGSPCAGDANCPAGQDCLEGFCGCEGMRFQAAQVPPNMLISLDRSSSMVTNDVTPGVNRWTVAKNAITALLTAHGDSIRFGLKLWPGSNLECNSGGDCSSGTVQVAPGENTAGDINTDLGDADTCNYGTPITGSLNSLVGYEALLDPDRPNYVILITDGQQQSCSGDPVAAVTALKDQTPSVKTFVVGFSGGVDADQLADMAEAAGTARDGDPVYYQADNAEELNDAFNQIAGSVLSCTYTLSGSPPDDDLYVYFDGAPVPRNSSDGWDYDPASNQLTFHGASCDDLENGDVDDLAIIYGCPSAPVD